MNTTCSFYRWVPLVVFLALTDCSSDGGTSGTGVIDPPGAHITQGSITGFGSVFVNGVEYDTKASTITLEGITQSEDKLAVGMVVKISGRLNTDGKTGVAAAIEYADELEGIVLSIDPVAKTVNVMGQTVHVTAETLYAGALGFSLATMRASNVIEVSGYSSGHGDIFATRVELKKMDFVLGDEVELKGVVTNLNTDSKTFMVGTLTINYSGASADDIPGALSNDLYVEIKSTSTPVNNVLVADKIEVEGDGYKGVVGEDGDTVELEGIVTSVNSSTRFALNGQIILLDSQTQYENGTVANIVVDAKLEVEGQFDASGTLTAKTIKFREASAITLSAQVSAINPTLNSVVVLGLSVQINNLTVLKDERDNNPVRDFGVNNLRVDDYVEMQIYKEGSGRLVATQLIRNDADSPGAAYLSGVIEKVALPAGLLTVAGVTVAIPSDDTQPYENGYTVKVKGSFVDNILIADDIDVDN